MHLPTLRFAAPLILLLLLLPLPPVQAAPADSAARWLLDQIDTALPGSISYDRLEAGLAGPIIFENLRYEDGELRVRIARFQLDWSLSALLSRTARIELLQASDIEIHLPPPPDVEPPSEPTEPLTLPDVTLPIAIAIERGEIDQVRVYSAGNPDPLILNSARLRLRSEEQTLHLEQFTVQTPELEAALSGQLTPVGSYPLDLSLEWAYQDPTLERLSGQGQISGDLTALNLTHTLSGAVAADLRAAVRDALTQPVWDVALDLNIADLAPFAPELAAASLTGQLQSSGSLDRYSASGSFTTSALPEVGAVKADFKASGDEQTLTLQTLSLSTSAQPLRLALAGSVDLADQTVNLTGQWRELAWPLTGTAQFASPSGELAVTGTFDDYRLRLDTLLSGPDFGRLRAEIMAEGSTEQAQVTALRVTAPDGELALIATAAVRFADLAFAAQGEWSGLVLPLVGPPQAHSPSGRFTASGTPQQYTASLDAQLTGTLPQPVSAHLELTGNPDTLNLRELSLSTPGQGPQLGLQGEVMLADLNFAVEGHWQDLVWPLIGPPQVQSPRGQVRALGTPDDYAFDLSTEVQGPDIPPGRWQLKGAGSTEALEQLTLNGRVLGGELNADLQARWLPTVSWSGRITASDIQPGQQWPDLPGRLALALQSQGQLTDAGIDAGVELEQLSGTLRGQAIDGSGRVMVAGEQVTIDGLTLTAGSARLAVSGELAERWDIDWSLQVDSLAKLLPDIRGRINSEGSLTGTPAAPRAEFTLQVADLAAAGQRIEALNGSGLVDLSGAAASKLEFSGRGLDVGGQRFQRLTLNGSGTPAEHALQAALAGELGQFALALNGGVQETRWSGRLTGLSLEKTLAGDWRLAEPVAISADPTAARLGDLCLQSRPTRLCVSGDWSESAGVNAQLRLDDLTPARFAQWLPDTLGIETQLDATATARVPPDGAFQAEATLQLAAGQLRFLAEGNPITVPLRASTLTVNATPRLATTSARIDLGTFGQLNAEMRVIEPTGQPRLDGRIQAAIDDLTLVEQFAPQVEKVQGRIVADLGVRGDPARPDITGSVQLVDAGLVAPVAGIEVTDMELTVSGAGAGTLAINGGLRSGPGRLQITGSIDPATQSVDVRINGEQFQIVNTREIQAQIAPDLAIAVADGSVRVAGQVQIPQANIAPPDLPPSGVGVSGDVVIVRGAEGETLTPVERTAQALFVKVRVILGDEVWVDVGDFQGRLVGDLLVEQTPQLAPRATGSIGVATGTYKVYGQELNIERGQVLFSGGPVDNPGLDLRVAREVEADDVTAGVNISGTLRNPQLKLFSEPAMPDTSILSYLIFGRAPDSRAGSESQLLLRLAASLSAGGGNLFTGRIAEAAGLDTLEFESGETVQQTSLLLGKYLTPDLYVGYGIGLFERVNSFNIRYQLSKRLSLESRSSAESMGADLIYTIER